MANSTSSAGADKLPSKEDFAALLEESFGATPGLEGTVVKGRVVGVENDMAVIDVGLKSEGRVPLKDFAVPGHAPEIKIGDEVEVFLDRMENAQGEAVISREKARREEAWTHLEKAFEKTERVDGIIFGRVKGGFTVDLSGAVAFLPGSQVDVRPVRDVTPLMNISQPFQILKMDRRRGNIVVSRRAVLEEARAEARTELISVLKEGQVLEGVVKNITDYGAFVDLGGIDGLLHVTDIAWRRVGHPTEALSIGQTLKVQVIKVNPETQRISLGMKQLEADPWEGVDVKYPVGVKFTGRVTNITDYGAFVELEPGVEGLVHVSEMSWTKKNVHPGKIVSTSQEVEVMVLDVDPKKRRISLGLKQCMENPWTDFAQKYPVGTQIEGEIKNITEFGLFVGLEDGIDGMVHLSDLDWEMPGDEAIKTYKKADVVKGVVLDVDIEKERVSLGIKQLKADPIKSVASMKKGDIVTCTVAGVQDNGIEVTVGDGLHAFIRRSDLARDRSEQRPDKFAVGDKVDAQVTNFDKASRKLALSIKAREIAEEKEAVAQYGSSDSGASLGDILGAAISKAREVTETATGKSESKAKSKKKAVEADETDTEAAESAADAESAEEKPAKKAKSAKTTKAKTSKSKAKKDDAADADEK
jgi:small subunit ribosomal protein S1